MHNLDSMIFLAEFHTRCIEGVLDSFDGYWRPLGASLCVKIRSTTLVRHRRNFTSLAQPSMPFSGSHALLDAAAVFVERVGAINEGIEEAV
jgi:hypothetical protein